MHCYKTRTLIFTSPRNCGNGYTGIVVVLSIVIGLLLMFNALAAGQFLVIVLGIFMAIGGIVAIVWAFRMR